MLIKDFDKYMNLDKRYMIKDNTKEYKTNLQIIKQITTKQKKEGVKQKSTSFMFNNQQYTCEELVMNVKYWFNKTKEENNVQ